MNLTSRDLRKDDDIEHDAFVESAIKGYEFVRRNRFAVFGSLAVVALAALFTFYVIRSNSLKESRAGVLLNRGMEFYNADDYAAADPYFRQTLELYAGTRAALAARYFLGVSALVQGDTETARRMLEEYLGGNPLNGFMIGAAHGGIAACAEAEGDWQAAAEEWARAGLSHEEQNFNAPQFLLNGALCYETAGRPDEARPLLERLLEKYPSSTLKNRAEIVLMRLDAMK